MGILQTLIGGGSQPLIGLDIGASSVKLLELSMRGQRYLVEAYATEPLPDNAIVDRQIHDSEAVGEAIARAHARAGTKTRRVAAAVPGASAITKIIQMPAGMSDADLEEQIKVEADQYIPHAVEEVNLDFEILGPSRGDETQVDVLLVACKREHVENLCGAIELAGLVPAVVDIEPHALENAAPLLAHQIPDRGRDKTVALFDVGAVSTSLLVIHDLAPVYSREQPFGGRQLVEEVMRHFGMGVDEAVKALRYGNLPESYQTEVLPDFLGDLAQQMDRTLQFFFSSATEYPDIDLVLLAGGCAQIPGAAEALTERLGLPVQIARPLSDMDVSARARPKQLAAEEPALVVACGLALRAFDPER